MVSPENFKFVVVRKYEVYVFEWKCLPSLSSKMALLERR